jgi:hypothetical protein
MQNSTKGLAEVVNALDLVAFFHRVLPDSCEKGVLHGSKVGVGEQSVPKGSCHIYILLVTL